MFFFFFAGHFIHTQKPKCCNQIKLTGIVWKFNKNLCVGFVLNINSMVNNFMVLKINLKGGPKKKELRQIENFTMKMSIFLAKVKYFQITVNIDDICTKTSKI